MTPEQKFYAIINLVTIGIILMLLWLWLVDVVFDWIERRFVEPYKELLRRLDRSIHDEIPDDMPRIDKTTPEDATG